MVVLKQNFLNFLICNCEVLRRLGHVSAIRGPKTRFRPNFGTMYRCPGRLRNVLMMGKMYKGTRFVIICLLFILKRLVQSSFCISVEQVGLGYINSVLGQTWLILVMKTGQ
ncbi:hypothetical protein AVEN_249162-1 [Araneus ventricosus]|uniref:Uncharacterized protein n=1 Tax=Araneus ventricosus TaxID=182803 RepID=A0A4Y2D5P2_ARAVE|nr:hypothetical protein AVEN_249162-1 [Araneus ventricosus]